MADEEQNEQQEGAESIAEVEPTADVEAEAAEAEAPEEPEATAIVEPGAEVEEGPAEPTAEVEAPPLEDAPAEEAPPEDVPAEEEAGAEEAAPGEAAPAAEGERPPTPVPARKPKPKRKPRSERRQRSKPRRERPETRKAITRLPKPEHVRGRRVERRGIVVSNAMDKTIVVQVETVKSHPRYKKVIRRSRKFHAHDEQNRAKVGDVVRIVESRPLSATKNWRLVEVLEEAQ